MSWPTDGRPRFVAASVTGFCYPGGTNSRSATKWQVLDRAFNHEIVWQQQQGKGGSQRRAEYAHELAAELNASHGQ